VQLSKANSYGRSTQGFDCGRASPRKLFPSTVVKETDFFYTSVVMENLNTVDLCLRDVWKGGDILKNKYVGQSSAILHYSTNKALITVLNRYSDQV
jgi:hypothetical protein